MNSEQPPEATEVEFGKMSRLQKFAAFLVMLGPDGAGQILKDFENNELAAIGREMAKFEFVSQQLQIEILREFSNVAVQASGALRGGS